MKRLLIVLLGLSLLLGAVASGVEASVTMKFPAGVTVFHDRSGSAVKPDASGNASVADLEISDYLAAGFTFYTDWLNEGSTNLYYTDARVRAAVSSTATGLTYTGSTGVFSLTAGYAIPRSTHPEDVGAFANPQTALGDLIYGGAAGAATRLAGNTTASKLFLGQTGDGVNSAAPVWGALEAGDIPDISATYLTAAQKAAASGVASLDGSSKVVEDPANATATPTASKIPIAEGGGTLAAGWIPDLSGTYLTAAQKAAASGVASLDGSSKVVEDPANATATPTASKIPIADGAGTLNAWYTPTTPLAAYAEGTAYALTATPAQAVFGTTTPSLTVSSAGTWAIRYRAHVKYTGATFATNETATLKLRRTNNTAADLNNSPATAITNVVTTETGTLAWVECEVIYTTANTDDVIELWGSVSDVPSAGSLDVVEANIIAIATK